MFSLSLALLVQIEFSPASMFAAETPVCFAVADEENASGHAAWFRSELAWGLVDMSVVQEAGTAYKN